MKPRFAIIMSWVTFGTIVSLLISVLPLINLWSVTEVFAEPDYNTAFFTDEQLEDYDSMSTDQIRAFLASYGSYFQQPIQDVDGVIFDPPEVIAQASTQYQINPQVLLTTLQKESSGVTRTTRPSDTTMRFLMGCISSNTARQQLTCVAERFRAYHDQLTNTGSTISGWQVGVPKNTQDGVTVTPATKAIAGQFTYTPYAGVQWGGSLPSVGGVYLFYYWWSQFDFGQQQNSETLIIHFTDGPYAVTSQQEYLGLVTITVSDIGQASGTQYSDAFYLLTDYNGNPIDPVHPTLLYNWVLWINGQHAENLIPGQQVPSYRGDHTYTFEINAPGGNLVFGVGDSWTADNTSSYTIHINTPSSNSIPFFSQRDPRWITHTLRTNGVCSSSCSTIGACGCTLTASAMLFASYGTNLTPPTLSDCMGPSACPFDWSGAASCSNGQATWVNRYTFSWARLDQELNQNGRPVILGMHRSSNISDTHWVLVTNGYGSNASDYLIHDPWPLDGANTNLNIYARQNYVFDWLSVYDGQLAFNLVDRDTNHQNVSPAQTMQSDEYQASTTVVFNTAIIPTPTPIATGPTKLASVTPTSNTVIAASSTISGSIFVYHLSETAVTVQLTATSTVSDVTEMQVWTDSNPASAWQTFDSFAWLPWMPEDKVYARFRDGLGNISNVYSDSIRPEYSPPLGSQIFLPIILKSQ